MQNSNGRTDYEIFGSARTSLYDLWNGSKCLFTPIELDRNAYFNFKHKLFTGQYAQDLQLIVRIDNKDKTIPYNVLKLNYFKLITNKIDSIIFQNDIVIKGKNQEQTDIISAIVEETNFLTAIRQAMITAEIYGNAVIRVNYNGANVLDPAKTVKVVSSHDIDDVLAIVIYEPLPYNQKESGAIRIEVNMPGNQYEAVYTYNGDNKLGDPISYKYRDRYIPKKGLNHKTGTNINTCQWLSINKLPSDVYGQSPYDEIQDLVFSLERTTSANLHVISQNSNPYLIVGMQMFTTNESTGCYELKTIGGADGRYLISDGDSQDPKYLEGGAENLQQSRDFSEDLKKIVYEFSEMSTGMMNGEVSSNISNDTVENAYKNTLDRANRELSSVWYEIRNALCCLVNIRGMSIEPKDIMIDFPTGRSMSEMEKADTATKLKGTLSHSTILQKLYGYTEEQTRQEEELLAKENISTNEREVQI